MLVTCDAPLQQQTDTTATQFLWTDFWTKKVQIPVAFSGSCWNEKRRLSVYFQGLTDFHGTL